MASPTQPLLGSQSTLTKQAASLALPIPLGSPVLGLLHADAEQAVKRQTHALASASSSLMALW
ncbi:hypothetical protein HaLaN_16050 [Haematococcus lacustris]|uniref:Uncharacterized protein n=1 Tax=Haematococcus lacustris TaxID=44745 RepID=A0A699Z917_HAELA|nr:hypothetical protein HaLaN_16050 [Haematococcus lacustris]